MQRWRAIGLASLWACGGSSDGFAPSTSVWSSSVTRVVVEVDFEDGSAPYTGSAGRIQDIWSLSQSNLDRLFAGKVVDVPHTLESMERLPALEDEDFTVDAILALAERYRDVEATGTRQSLYAIWLDGYFFDGERQPRVLGVALGSTGIVAMFKPVIRDMERIGTDALARFAEQATMIHEVGHAAGLVENGIPALSDHHDAENGAHCTNRDCVMYHLNEGAADLVDFVSRYVTTGSTLMFGPACLEDADAANASL
ncbi:MAG: hypothetical protein ACFB9M_09575 [Myxococcota bacterium]